MNSYKFEKVDIPEHFNLQSGEGNNWEFPITEEQIQNQETPCNWQNICVGDNKIEGKGKIIIPPNFNIKEETAKILEVRSDVNRGVFPEWFYDLYYPFNFPRRFGAGKPLPPPLVIGGLSKERPDELANSVQMDKPSKFAGWLLDYLAKELNLNALGDSPMFKNFIELVPQYEKISSEKTLEFIREIFKFKYFFGLPRPQEIYEAVWGIPGWKMTAYGPDHTSHIHPEFPFGHAATALGAMKGAEINFMLKKKKYKEIMEISLESSWSFWMSRCLAGLHYGGSGNPALIYADYEEYMKPELVDAYLCKM